MSEKRLVTKKKGKKKLTKKNLGIAAAIVVIIAITIWLCDVLYGESDNPVDWAHDMPRESIASVELFFTDIEGYPSGLNVTMTEEMVDELYDIIHNLKRNDFTRGSVSNYESAIFIRCHNAEFLLEYKGGATGLNFDEASGAVYGGGRDWKITSDAIGEFIEKYKVIYLEQLGITENE